MFSPETIRQIRIHAEHEFPRESCGLVIGGRYHPCMNVAEDAINHFVIDPVDSLTVCDGDLSRIQAIIHSHPIQRENDPIKIRDEHILTYPSLDDQLRQIDSGVPWGITVCIDKHSAAPYFWGPGVPVPPLKQRKFVYSVQDCSTLVRDWYKQEYGIDIRVDPSAWGWWDDLDAKDMYSEENLHSLGFTEKVLSVKDLKRGDILLGRLKTKRRCHVAVYLGGGLVLHHLPQRLSDTDPANVWVKSLDLYYRHKELA